eukprot:c17710_g1_i1 orf=63-326(+)
MLPTAMHEEVDGLSLSRLLEGKDCTPLFEMSLGMFLNSPWYFFSLVACEYHYCEIFIQVAASCHCANSFIVCMWCTNYLYSCGEILR